jgi:hypothetical protein
MATDYRVNMRLCLRPINQPRVLITAGGKSIDQTLTHTQEFEFDFVATNPVIVQVHHVDKLDSDPDTAVEIASVSFFGISDPQLVWAGVYAPAYPSHMTGPELLPGQTYLGWNGTWTLEFSVPVFSWMHQKLNLGWLYQ